MRFHDRHEWIHFLKAQEIARRIVADPSMIEDARRFIQRHMRPDPHRARYVAMWDALLDRPAADIAASLVEDSPRGCLLRETRPVFGTGPTPQEVVALIERAHAPAA